MPGKEYVEVFASHDEMGNISPRAILWKDGRRFNVDRVTDVRKLANLDAGGSGVRYMCRIMGREKPLYFERSGRWFVVAAG